MSEIIEDLEEKIEDEVESTRRWIITDLVKRGDNALRYYDVLYARQPSYRHLVFESEYPDLMIQKIDCCYGETISKYKNRG